MKKVSEFFLKIVSRETILYVLFGLATTAINFSMFALLNKCLSVSWEASNIAAWTVSVLFAFVTNKLVVFSSKSRGLKTLIWELSTFIGARLASLGIEYIGLYLMIDTMHCEELISKLVINIIVVIINYVLSKFITFKNKT